MEKTTQMGKQNNPKWYRSPESQSRAIDLTLLTQSNESAYKYEIKLQKIKGV